MYNNGWWEIAKDATKEVCVTTRKLFEVFITVIGHCGCHS